MVAAGRARRGPTTRSSPSSCAARVVAEDGRSGDGRGAGRRLSTRRARAGADIADGRRAATVSLDPPSGDAPVQFVDVFPGTADRKVHLVPEDLDREAPWGSTPSSPSRDGRPRSPSSRRRTDKRGQLDPRPAPPRPGAARDAPRRTPRRAASPTATACGSGTRYGEVRCSGCGSRPTCGPAWSSLPKGLWSHNTDNGATANALAPDTLADLGGGACFNDARVEVAKLD